MYINYSKAKEIESMIDFIEKSEKPKLIDYLNKKTNRLKVISLLLEELLSKNALDKLFDKDVFSVLISDINLKRLINSCNFYKLLNHYKVTSLFAVEIFNSDIYNLIENIDETNESCLYFFFGLLFFDKRCNIPDAYKKKIDEQLKQPGNTSMYDFIQLITKQSLSNKDKKVLQIINDEFSTDFISLQNIYKENNISPKILLKTFYADSIGNIPKNNDFSFALEKITGYYVNSSRITNFKGFYVDIKSDSSVNLLVPSSNVNDKLITTLELTNPIIKAHVTAKAETTENMVIRINNIETKISGNGLIDVLLTNEKNNQITISAYNNSNKSVPVEIKNLKIILIPDIDF